MGCKAYCERTQKTNEKEAQDFSFNGREKLSLAISMAEVERVRIDELADDLLKTIESKGRGPPDEVGSAMEARHKTVLR